MFAAGVFACASLMAAALYFQHVLKLEPCPLCIFQRIFVVVAGVLMLLATFHNPSLLGRRVYGALIGGVRNWVWLAGLAIIAAIAFVVIEIADNRDKRMVETAQESGATGAMSRAGRYCANCAGPESAPLLK